MTLRVLHVIARLPASGTERQLVGMVRAAKATGLWDPTVAILYSGFDLSQELRNDDVPVIELSGRPAWHPQRPLALRALLTSGRYDVVHTSLWGGSAFTRVVAATVRPRPALVMSERRVEDFRRPWQRALDRALSATTNAYIGNSQSVTSFIERAHAVPADRITAIPNGIDTAVFRPRPTGEDAGMAGSAVLRLGAIGRLVEQKGFDLLIAALPLVARERPVALQIVGEGPLEAELRQAADGLPVTFVGLLTEPTQVAAFLHAVDVFVMPSRYEGLPNALLEAQACAIPAVATDAPGIAEASGPGVRLVEPESPAALAAGILAAADDAQGDKPVGQGHERRSFTEVAADHLYVFEQALRREELVG